MIQLTAMEFRHDYIRPVLKRMGAWSWNAEELLIGTAAHESMGFKHKKQLKGGPARSYFQIEPATLADLYINYLSYRPKKQVLLDRYLIDGFSRSDMLLESIAYSIVAARLQYMRKPGKIPKTLEAQAAYWKKHWNTVKGAGTIEKYIADYERYVI